MRWFLIALQLSEARFKLTRDVIEFQLLDGLKFDLQCFTEGIPHRLRFDIAGNGNRTVSLPGVPPGPLTLETANPDVYFIAMNSEVSNPPPYKNSTNEVPGDRATDDDRPNNFGSFGLANTRNEWLLELAEHRLQVGKIDVDFPFVAPLISQKSLEFEANCTIFEDLEGSETIPAKIQLDPTLGSIYSSYSWWHRIVSPLNAVKTWVTDVETILCNVRGEWPSLAVNFTGSPGPNPRGAGVLMFSPGQYAVLSSEGCFHLPWVPSSAVDGITFGRPFFQTRQVALIQCDSVFGCIEISSDSLRSLQGLGKVAMVTALLFTVFFFIFIAALCLRDSTKEEENAHLHAALLGDNSQDSINIVARVETEGKLLSFFRLSTGSDDGSSEKGTPPRTSESPPRYYRPIIAPFRTAVTQETRESTEAICSSRLTGVSISRSSLPTLSGDDKKRSKVSSIFPFPRH